MAGKALRTLSRTAGERVMGIRPGPLRAAIGATVAGAATAAVTYKLLRSGS
jgi:hypothetical protein